MPKPAKKKDAPARRQGHAAPWDQDNPKKPGEHQALSPQAKATAKRRARAAGRPYPNLVDNMRAARESKPGRK